MNKLVLSIYILITIILLIGLTITFQNRIQAEKRSKELMPNDAVSYNSLIPENNYQFTLPPNGERK